MLVIIFGIFPIMELFLNEKQDIIAPNGGKIYDYMLYSIVPIHFYLLYSFLYLVSSGELAGYELIGLTISMGYLCGIYGINAAHELGHRSNKYEQSMAQMLLLSSMYMHFFIEHNRGHHKKVGTPEDPATARKNETVYAFWIRSVSLGYLSAFRLEKNRLKRLHKPWFSINNEFIRFQLIQLLFCILVYFIFGLTALFLFLVSALIGIILLETVNYVEHYGLFRKEIQPGIYEHVEAMHSWNSDLPLGRSVLFELTRHSHHHLNSLIKYPSLESVSGARQLPTGYPGMMILSLIPPLWFNVMNKRLEKVSGSYGSS